MSIERQPVPRQLGWRRKAAAWAAMVAVGPLSGCTIDPGDWWPPSPSETPTASGSPSPSKIPRPKIVGKGLYKGHDASRIKLFKRSTVLKHLAQLPIRDEVQRTGYKREQYGGWIHRPKKNPCDTREEMLKRDMADAVVNARNCIVFSGTLYDPYTGTRVIFRSGQSVNIDHRVALEEASESGADQWTYDDRVKFANDPLNLETVSGRANFVKGAGDIYESPPDYEAVWCTLAAAETEVKFKYGLAMDMAEFNAARGILRQCGFQIPVTV